MKGKSSGMGPTGGITSIHDGLSNKAPSFSDKSMGHSKTSVNKDAVRGGVQSNQRPLGPRTA